MLRLAGLLSMIVFVAAAPAHGLGGLAVHGAGTGTYESNDGKSTCPNSPFVVEALYLPDDKGILHSEFAGSCLGTAGLTFICCQVAVNTSQNPIVKVTFYCVGNEAAGLECSAQVGNTLVTASLSPYAGVGGTMTLSTRGAYKFDGSFVAA